MVVPDPKVRALMALARAKTAGPRDLLAELTAWFASKAAIRAVEFPADLVDELVEHGFTREAAEEAGRLASYPPLTGRTRHGSPRPLEDMTTVRRVASEEPGMRAAYVMAAAERLTEAQGGYDAALARERLYRDLHVAAARNRRSAARELDRTAADSPDGKLVWRTAGDDRVDSVCRRMDNRIFTVDDLPDGLIPGAVHPRCRCTAEVYGGAFRPPT